MANSNSLKEAVGMLKAVSKLKNDVGTLARAILPLLKQVPKEMTGEAITRPSRRGTDKIAYLVELTQQGEVLSEERLSGKSKAFRCRRQVYEAVADVLNIAKRPLLLDEIVAGVEQKLGDRPADHQVRVALRMWLHTSPAMIRRNRARYTPTDAPQFVSSTKELWETLKMPIFS